ncbi:MAG: sugar-binding protein [Planctomycetota bacterium]|nr:sugar-binding protein [Planctomycetota bacterium]MDA1178770.1 sugar-binding protein [Planctomycetota bacterium]
MKKTTIPMITLGWTPGFVTSFLCGILLLVGCRPTNVNAPDAAVTSHKSGSDEGGTSSSLADDSADRPTVAFVTNQIADFWKIAEVGCNDAEKEFNVKVDVKMPQEATAVEQKRIVEDLLSSGVKGIAISPLAADDQVGFLNEVAAKVPLITHDSDAPNSNRLLYIGMDNYRAGRMCGELIKEALPQGGKVVLFVGRLEQDNAKYRRQGIIDELLGRTGGPGVHDDDPQNLVSGDKYTILATLTDQGKPEVAKQKAEDAINTYADMNAMVGLFEYNPPVCFEAIKQAGKLGQIKLIAFDENSVTLQAIRDGHCHGTVVQNPYEYGYQSVKALASILREEQPAAKFIDIPPRQIRIDNVDAYWDDLKNKTAGN